MINYAIGSKYDLCVVASAGNDGVDNSAMMRMPTNMNGVIEVSSLMCSKSQGKSQSSGKQQFQSSDEDHNGQSKD